MMKKFFYEKSQFVGLLNKKMWTESRKKSWDSGVFEGEMTIKGLRHRLN